MCLTRWISVAVLAGALASRGDNTGVDGAAKTAWGENVGWLTFSGIGFRVARTQP